MIKNEYYTLSNGLKIPKVGLGTWQSKEEDCYNSVVYALRNGYTHIDTAYVYENEHLVAKAIKDCNVKREDLFITTKLPANIKTYDGAYEYFNKSLANLETDYVDLYLIHAPWPWENVGSDCTEGNIAAWKAMIELYNAGKCKAIGVSNFHAKDIQALIDATGVKPLVNQIRFFVGNRQDAIYNYCQENDILIQAYSPMATGEMLTYDVLDEIAKNHNVSKAQVCIRYCLQKNTNPLPKSVHEQRVIQNIDLDFELTKEEMDYLDNLHHVASTRRMRD